MGVLVTAKIILMDTVGVIYGGGRGKIPIKEG
jgi:hypothetical protein